MVDVLRFIFEGPVHYFGILLLLAVVSPSIRVRTGKKKEEP